MADYTEGFEALALNDTITTSGWDNPTGVKWKCDTYSPNTGTKCLKGTGPNNVVTTVTLTKDMADGTASFYWRVSSENTFDKLVWKYDGTTQATISGEVGWTQVTKTVTAGSHTIEWTFSRDAGGSSGFNAGWIDDIVIPLQITSFTGTMDLTEQADACAFVGVLETTGEMPVVEQGDSASISGIFPFLGILSITEGNDSGRIYANLGTFGTIAGIESADLSGIILYHLWPSARGIPEYIVYRVTLSQSGLSDYVIPVSYWSCNKQSIGINYFNCIVPDAYSHEAAIVARATGNLAISKGEVYADGSVNWATIMSVSLQQISVGYGEADATITLGGNSQKLTTVPKTVALSGVSYRSETNGSVRLRAEVDLFAEVGDTITYGTDSFVASSITYSVAADGQALMEIAA